MNVLSSLSNPDRRLWAYPLAVALVLLTLWVRLHIDLPFYGPVLIMFIIPIILSACWGGIGPGLLATAVSFFSASYYLLPPIGSFAVASNTQVLQQVILAVAGAVISVICEKLHSATRRANAERVMAEAGQQASTTLAGIVEDSTDAIIGKTLDGIITSWNAAARDTFGYEAEEVIGRHISLLIPPDRLAEEDEIISQLRIGLRIDHYETVRRHKSGAEVFVSLLVSPIRDAAGRIVGASKIARNFTEKRRSDAQLQALQSDLAHFARLSEMAQMSAVIAHELNQPLTAIVNYVSAAQRILAHDPSTQGQASAIEAMKKASAQILRAGAIIQSLREFTEKREADRSREDLKFVVEEAIALGAVGAAGAGVVLNQVLDPGALPVRINRIQIQQVLINMMRNAVEAMATSLQRVMTLTMSREEDFAVVTIRDTGPGLPPEILAKLFQPFVTTKEKGMGIGLNISQSIMNAHGGKIEALASIGAGAVFRISLPLDGD